ncbi:MAG: ribosome silencing factor [Muribaculaceae bacterium]|nr:ribosome silencing factor [Muribaculaceae bacterium]
MTKTTTATKENNITQLRPIIIEGIQERKGRSIAVVDLSEIESAPVSEFIICQGNSTQQVAAIADSVRDYLLDNYGIKPYNYDGYRNAQWIVIDYGDTLVHVFTRETRQLYNLEELWADAPITEIPDLD